MQVAHTEYLLFEDQPAIVVERFDRLTTPDGEVVRVHQEDFCQTLALDPSRKYESDKGPGVERLTRLLNSVTTDDSRDRFVRAVIANQMVGAPDAHAKNYAMMLAGRAATLAPLYDVATGLLPNQAGRLRYRRGAMSIGGERRFGDVEGRHWDRFAAACGLPATTVRQWVAELGEALPDAFAQAAAETNTDETQFIVDTVLPNVTAVCHQTVRGLTETRHQGDRVVVPFLDTPA